MIDLALLRIIKYREQFEKVHRYIPKSAIDKKTKAITDDIRKYFEINEDDKEIDFPSFRSMFFTTWHKGLSDSDCEFFNKLLERMEEDVSESVKKNIINQLLELEFATNVGNVLDDYQAGEDIEVVPAIDNLVSRVKESLERTNAFEFADFDDSTVGEENDDTGYSWPLRCMNEHYRKIQGGDQYIVAARPGKGKTTFLTHLNYSMSKQMPKNKVIVWFNNESRRQRIMSRQIQSALYMTNGELRQLQAKGTLRDEYVKVMGAHDRVRVYDIHGKNNFHLEEILEGIGLDNVGAIVMDMLDNVKFPTLKDVREDQRLEQLYQWARELGVRYNCPVFPTSQVSNEGAGLMFPNENMLKDSKTGKQGACDGIIMLGSSDDPLLQNKRGISMPKTKSKREGMPDLMEEITFDADKGRYL
ncbi:putative DnaB-like helicase [Alteromonas phage vB_AspP-H4/4]|uniref:DnaB-like helicase n=1 Tax=Alteromonas phage vB_AspP-H4/4 TaxID=2928692 RepID=A0A220YL53_9CAUD|nr:putative DnaB-like helicase [Alteromonas phage vB_AspP-H4/4]ASL24398.1 putative DnaB-like helicase [Alteromonas phage vB_AspP-H4/4]